MIFVPIDNEIRGKRISKALQPNSGVLVDYGIVSNHIEFDLINLSSSGLEWLDSPIAPGTAKPIIFELNNYKSGSTFNLSARIKGHSGNSNSSSSHVLKILYNNLNGIQIGQTENWSGSTFRTITSNNQTTNLIDGFNIFYLANSSPDQNSFPYLDYFRLDYAKIKF